MMMMMMIIIIIIIIVIVGRVYWCEYFTLVVHPQSFTPSQCLLHCLIISILCLDSSSVHIPTSIRNLIFFLRMLHKLPLANRDLSGSFRTGVVFIHSRRIRQLWRTPDNAFWGENSYFYLLFIFSFRASGADNVRCSLIGSWLSLPEV